MSPGLALSLTLWRGARVGHAGVMLIGLCCSMALWLLALNDRYTPSEGLTLSLMIPFGPFLQSALLGGQLGSAIRRPETLRWAKTGLNPWIAVVLLSWWLALVVPASMLTQAAEGLWVWCWYTSLVVLAVALGLSLAWTRKHAAAIMVLPAMIPQLVPEGVWHKVRELQLVAPVVIGISLVFMFGAAWIWARTRSHLLQPGRAPLPDAPWFGVRLAANAALPTQSARSGDLLYGLVHLRTEPRQRWGIAVAIVGMAILLRHPIESLQENMFSRGMIWIAAWGIASFSMPWATGSGGAAMGWKIAPRAWLVPGGLRRPLTSWQLIRLTGATALKRWLIVNALVGLFAAFYADFRWHDLPALMLWTGLASLLSAHLWLYIAASRANPMNVGPLPILVPLFSVLLMAWGEASDSTWWWLLTATGLSAALAMLLPVRWGRAELRS